MIVKLEKKERGRKEEGMMSAETAEGEKDEKDEEDREEECYGKGREERVCVCKNAFEVSCVCSFIHGTSEWE